MADEFIAQIESGRSPPILDVVETLTLDRLCTIEAVREEEVLLRWADVPRRDSWPEDISLSVLQNGFLVSIHAGTKDHRASLIARIEAYLSKASGSPVILEDA
jgi:hypothetical protein